MDDFAAQLTVRPFERNEQDGVRELVLAGIRERWDVLDESLNQDLNDFASTYGAGTTLTAWDGKRLVATGTLVPRGDGVGEILRMSTAAAHRRQGVASRILRELVAEARARGMETLVLETASHFTDARALYEARGFVFDHEEDGEFCLDSYYRLALAPP